MVTVKETHVGREREDKPKGKTSQDLLHEQQLEVSELLASAVPHPAPKASAVSGGIAAPVGVTPLPLNRQNNICPHAAFLGNSA